MPTCFCNIAVEHCNEQNTNGQTSANDEHAMAKNLSHSMSPVRLPIRSSSSNNSFGSAKSCHFSSITVTGTTLFDPICQQQQRDLKQNLLMKYYKCLANAKRPCDCRVLCLRLKSSLCSCAHSISDMTSFSCRDQGRDSVCPVL